MAPVIIAFPLWRSQLIMYTITGSKAPRGDAKRKAHGLRNACRTALNSIRLGAHRLRARLCGVASPHSRRTSAAGTKAEGNRARRRARHKPDAGARRAEPADRRGSARFPTQCRRVGRGLVGDPDRACLRIRHCSNPSGGDCRRAYQGRGDRGTARLCAIMEKAARRETPADLDALARPTAGFHRLIIDAARSDHLTRLITMRSTRPSRSGVQPLHGGGAGAQHAAPPRNRRRAGHRDPAWAGSAMRTHILASIGVARGSKIAAQGELSEG